MASGLEGSKMGEQKFCECGALDFECCFCGLTVKEFFASLQAREAAREAKIFARAQAAGVELIELGTCARCGMAAEQGKLCADCAGWIEKVEDIAKTLLTWVPRRPDGQP